MLSMARFRAARSDDRGMSLTELLVSMMIFGALMAMIMTVMITLTNMSKDSVARTQAIQEARLGVAQIDRQVRSGNVILDPGLEPTTNADVPKFYSLRIYTQEDGVNKCAQWRVKDHDGDDFGDLEYRTWDPLIGAASATTWSPVAHNLVDMAVAPTDQSQIDADDPATWPPFWINTGGAGTTEAQFISITLRLKDPAESDGKPTTISTTVTGRNTVFGYPTTTCSDVPAP